MIRLRNTESGVVVMVDEATAAALGPEWKWDEPAPPPKPAPKRRAPAK